MKRYLVVLLVVLSASLALAQPQPEPPRIPFQGQLRNYAGEIVPDSLFPMTFRIYSDSLNGLVLWSETHTQVATRGGNFNALLGSINPISLDLLNGGPLFLETRIGEEDPPLDGKFRIGSAAKAGSAQRVAGDLFTMPGRISLFTPDPEPPPDPTLEINAGLGGDASIRMFAPQPEPPFPDPLDILSINSSPTNGASIRMFAPQPEPPHDPLLLMNTGPGGQASIRMFAPQPEPPRPEPFNILNIFSSPADGGSFEMFAPQAEYGAILVNANPQVKLSCDSTHSSLLVQRARNITGGMGDSTGIDLRSDSLFCSMKMFGGGDQKLDIGANPSGGYSRYFSNGSEYMGLEPSPFNGGGTFKMLDLSANPTIELTSSGSAQFSHNGNEYMGIDSSPFHAGGDLVMSDSDGVTSMAFSSLGSASFFSGGTEYMGIDPAPFGGTLQMSNPSNNPSMQLSSDGSAGFFDNGTEYMGIEPMPFSQGGMLRMYGGAPIGTRVILSSDGKLSLGTSSTTNILTIQQSSPTDPIADAWTTYSSRRWKTNIQPLQGSLEKVMRLQGVSYDEIEGGKHNIGVIAEEVGAVVPEVVAYEENGVDAKSVDYARLTALLIEAVKEQQKTIEQLKSEIEQLKIR